MGFGKRIDNPGGHRHAVRDDVMIRAAMMTLTETVGVDLLDISKFGAKLRGHNFPAPGQEVVLLLGTLEAFGSVVWCDQDQCGVHFDISLSETALSTIQIERELLSQWRIDGETPPAACPWIHGLTR